MINKLINKVLKTDYRVQLIKLLKKLRINKYLSLLSTSAISISFLAYVTKNLLLIVISTILLSIIIIFFMLYLIESILNNNLKLIKITLNILLSVFSITVATILLSKIAFWIIPIYYPNNDSDKIYDLVFNTYTTIISSIIGIAGTYFGAIYGGKKAIEATKIQLAEQSKENENKKKEDEKFALKIISKLLKQEINYNFDILKKREFFKALNDNYINHGLPNNIKFEIYNNTKYELIKYSSNDSLVEELIDVYGLLDIITRYTSIGSINSDDKDKLLTLESKFENLINLINNITI